MAHLKSRDATYAAALGDESRIRVAVNQQHAGPGSVLGDNDEVAFFPPVTGG
jgi:molybdopterin synthase sulfur carrier subunit